MSILADMPHRVTAHASTRMVQRGIPPGIVDLILRYGDEIAARDGATRMSLSGRSLRAIRNDFGGRIAKGMEDFRRAYVVVKDGVVITCAHGSAAVGQ